MGFLKRAAPGHDLSCIIWKDGIFFPKTYLFPWTGSERWPFSRNTWKYDIFCVHVRVLQTWCHAPLPKKNQRWSYPAKIHLKVIDVLDWHPRKSYIGLKFGLFFNLLGWRHSTMNNGQYFVLSSPHERCLEVCLSANKGDYLSVRRWVIIPKM